MSLILCARGRRNMREFSDVTDETARLARDMTEGNWNEQDQGATPGSTSPMPPIPPRRQAQLYGDRTGATFKTTVSTPWSVLHNSRWLPLLDTLFMVGALLITLGLTQTLWLKSSTDPKAYLAYALQFWEGPHRFHSFPVEYPPLTVLIFGLTLLPTHTTAASAIMNFEGWMALLFFLGWGLFYRMSGRAAAWRYAVLVLALQNIVFTRFDLVPGLICVGALWVAQRRSWKWACFLLAIGALLKIFPAFVLPVVLIDQWSWSSRRIRPVLGSLVVFLVTVGLGVLIPFMLNPASLTSLLGYQSGRPVQVESAAGTVVWLGTLIGIPAKIQYTFGSDNWVGPLSVTLSPLAALLMGVGLLVVYWEVWQRSLSLAKAFLFCLGLVLLTNKVFSPQYVLWILPIAAEAGTDIVLWLLAALMTLVEYPLLTAAIRTFYSENTHWVVLLSVAARNALVCWGTVRALHQRDTSTEEATTHALGQDPLPDLASGEATPINTSASSLEAPYLERRQHP
jgi:hypothetical protein